MCLPLLEIRACVANLLSARVCSSAPYRVCGKRTAWSTGHARVYLFGHTCGSRLHVEDTRRTHHTTHAVAVCAAPTRVPTRVTAAKTLTVVCFLVCPRPRPRPSCEEIKKDTEGLQEFDSRLHMMNKERGAVQDRFDENKRWSDAFDKQIGPFEDRYLNLTSEISGLYDNAKKEHAAGINFLVRLVVCVGRV